MVIVKDKVILRMWCGNTEQTNRFRCDFTCNLKNECTCDIYWIMKGSSHHTKMLKAPPLEIVDAALQWLEKEYWGADKISIDLCRNQS